MIYRIHRASWVSGVKTCYSIRQAMNVPLPCSKAVRCMVVSPEEYGEIEVYFLVSLNDITAVSELITEVGAIVINGANEITIYDDYL